MATAFDFTTYPLDSRTGFAVDLNVARDVMDDGAPRIRVMGEKTYRTGRLVFEPMTFAEADALESYLIANRVTEFIFSGAGWAGESYYGYIWSEPQRVTIDGPICQVSVDVYARRGV